MPGLDLPLGPHDRKLGEQLTGLQQNSTGLQQNSKISRLLLRIQCTAYPLCVEKIYIIQFNIFLTIVYANICLSSNQRLFCEKRLQAMMR